MIFRTSVLQGIGDGTITLAFRRWRRPSVKSGGTLRTVLGLLQIGDVKRIAVSQITAADARGAGYSTRNDLLTDLDVASEGEIYRIEVGPFMRDPRVALRESLPGSDELQALRGRLRRLDARATEPWTLRVLELIEAHPALRAADLCKEAGQERLKFKINVRKLKALGLTESLEIGYRLSPRGLALLKAMRSKA